MLKTLPQKIVVGLSFLLISSCFSTFAQTSPQELVLQVKHAVVVVTVYDKYGQPLQQGSGFFIASDRIVTNLHETNATTEIRIKTFTGETALVQNVVANDPRYDLTILQINSPCHDTTSLQVANTSTNEGLDSNQMHSAWKVTVSKVGPTWNFEHLDSRMQITAGLAVGSSGDVFVKLRGYVVGNAVTDGTPRNSGSLDSNRKAHGYIVDPL